MSEPRINVSDPQVNGTAPEQAAPAEELPLLPIDSAVLFPGMFLPLVVSGDSWVKLVDDAALGSRQIGVFWRSRPDEAFDPLSLARTGVAAQIVRLLRQPDGGVQLLLQGQARIQLEQLLTTEPYPRARVRTLKTPEEPSLELEGLTRSALTAFQQIVQQSPSLPAELSVVAANLTAPGQLADLIAANLSITPADRQAVLDTLDPVERLRLVIGYLEREREILAIGERAREELSRSQRDYTHEAGVRDLERRLGAIYRKLATRLAEGEPLPAQVDDPDLDALLGPPRFRSETLLGEDEVGVVTGLAWTPAGGDVLFVEASAVAGSGQLILTGQLGDVMRESARAALTYTHSRAEQLGIPPTSPRSRTFTSMCRPAPCPRTGRRRGSRWPAPLPRPSASGRRISRSP